jgi:hypothetical protein
MSSIPALQSPSPPPPCPPPPPPSPPTLSITRTQNTARPPSHTSLNPTSLHPTLGGLPHWLAALRTYLRAPPMLGARCWNIPHTHTHHQTTPTPRPRRPAVLAGRAAGASAAVGRRQRAHDGQPGRAGAGGSQIVVFYLDLPYYNNTCPPRPGPSLYVFNTCVPYPRGGQPGCAGADGSCPPHLPGTLPPSSLLLLLPPSPAPPSAA